ncbi:hypothetical protein QFZ84_004711 [Pseudomonas fluorescens]
MMAKAAHVSKLNGGLWAALLFGCGLVLLGDADLAEFVPPRWPCVERDAQHNGYC